MTSMNRDTDYANMAQSIRFAIRQSLKDLYTCMPGIVESYDAETRRAVVKGALKVVTTKEEEIEREAIHNVPVVFPSGGGFAMTFPSRAGGPCAAALLPAGFDELEEDAWRGGPGHNRVLQ